MRVLLNIGLDNVPFEGRSYTNGRLNPTYVEQAVVAARALRAAGFEVYKTKLVQSDTEPTLVASAMWMGHAADFGTRLTEVSEQLQQDCIAVYNPITGQGELVGPHAAAWGPFNPEFFFLPDGTRLQAPVAKAA